MLWLKSPQWARWIVVALVFVVAAYFELRPAPTVQHPFATRAILAGEPLTRENTVMRQVPEGMLADVPADATVSRAIAEGSPVLRADISESPSTVPEGWWVVSLDLPANARVGDQVRVIVIDSGLVVEGYVTAPGASDSFSNTAGGVAVSGEHAAAVAGAATNGRVAVLLSTG